MLRRPAPRTSVHAILAVLFVGLLAASAVLAVQVRDARAQTAARDAALQAARQEAVNFVSLDYRQIKADVARVVAGATGDFRKQYQSGTAQIVDVVTKNQVVSTGTVLDAGVVASDSNSATVILAVDSSVANSSSKTPQLRHYRIQMTMSRNRDTWLTAQLSFVN